VLFVLTKIPQGFVATIALVAKVVADRFHDALGQSFGRL
jgi:hypothetical protein